VVMRRRKSAGVVMAIDADEAAGWDGVGKR